MKKKIEIKYNNGKSEIIKAPAIDRELTVEQLIERDMKKIKDNIQKTLEINTDSFFE